MRLTDYYRDAKVVRTLVSELHRCVTKPWRIMEVCGGQTHAILKYGIEQLLPRGLELIHGPGCPVCVVPESKIDTAIALAMEQRVILCSFGDMLRVPGSQLDLLTAKAQGASVQIVHSPLEALALAKATSREVVFFAIGFETTAPANALAVSMASAEKVANFSLLSAQVLVPPILEEILQSHEQSVGPLGPIAGLLAAGHVCTIMGLNEYESLSSKFELPIIVTGFEPVELLSGILQCVRQLEAGTATVENQYTRAVQSSGNPAARAVVQEVFEPTVAHWRGLGDVPMSGLSLRPKYAQFDADVKFSLDQCISKHIIINNHCLAGKVLTGQIKPVSCPAFGVSCTPSAPLGAPMVSSEGACAAYYRYQLSRPEKGTFDA